MNTQTNNQNKEQPNETSNLSTILISSVKDGGIQDIGIDIAEIGLDSILNTGVLEELPIFKTIISLTKTGLMIRDRIFIKKILLFLNEFDKISNDKKEEVIKNIKTDSDYAEKVGETVIVLLEQFDETEKACLLARLFSAYVRKIIAPEEFSRYSTGVNRVLLRDIKDLLSYYKGEKEEYQVFWEGLHQGGFSSIYINNLNIPNAKETI
ncbi:MAG: hypothetical protein Q8L68_07000, partial [Methylococcales bacterium]|nr:hypothetical protein [Methylococcales bacterium]